MAERTFALGGGRLFPADRRRLLRLFVTAAIAMPALAIAGCADNRSGDGDGNGDAVGDKSNWDPNWTRGKRGMSGSAGGGPGGGNNGSTGGMGH
jgi:hypothetical protein